jgi:tetratricopeptide (TPR) repeat protein
VIRRAGTGLQYAPGVTHVLRQAIAAYARGDLVEAERRCAQVIAAQADCFEAIYLVAVMQSQHGREAEALANYDNALALRPRFAEAHLNRGLLLHDMGRLEEALASHDVAVALAPGEAAHWFNRGVALQSLGRLEAALASYQQALAIAPDHVGAINNRGNILILQQRYPEALASFDEVLALAEDRAESPYNRGTALNLMQRHDEALASFDAALAVRPAYAEALNGRGFALHAEARFGEALEALDAALAIRPDFVEAHNNRGRTLAALRRFEEALASYRRAQALAPDYAKAHHNEALCRLLSGDFAGGFEKYEWRWGTEALQPLRRTFSQPLWLGGESIAGRTLLLHAEQGYGDSIQFCRYVKLVAERGARVVLEVQGALKRLLTGLQGANLVVGRGEPLPSFDCHCPLLSLPLAFGTTPATIPPPCRLPALTAEVAQKWHAKVGARERPRIGIAWSGNPEHGNDRYRSIPLAAMAALFDVPGEIISLQKEIRPADMAERERLGDRMLHFGEALTDFLDTAALVSMMDAVVSVDTSVAHLAATLGRPTFVLLPPIPDWRWLLDRPDSSWYPAVRMVRQRSGEGWDGTVVRAATEVAARLQSAT